MNASMTADVPLSAVATEDLALGREVLQCHRRGPAKVFPIAGFVLAALTVIFMGLLALDSGSATGSDFVVLGVIAAIFGGSGAAIQAYRGHVQGLRQVLRVHEHGIVRDDRRGRTVVVRFADVTKVEASVLNTALTST